MPKFVVALERLAADVPQGALGQLQWVSFNVAEVAFPTCTIETHVSYFATPRRGRRIIKAKRRQSWRRQVQTERDIATRAFFGIIDHEAELIEASRQQRDAYEAIELARLLDDGGKALGDDE